MAAVAAAAAALLSGASRTTSPEPERASRSEPAPTATPAPTANARPTATARPAASRTAGGDSAEPTDRAPSGAAESAAASGPAGPKATQDKPSRDKATQVTVVPGITRYHRSECILIRFLGPEDLETMTIAEAEASGHVPCKACRPEQELPGN
jgi:hypothetical protein